MDNTDLDVCLFFSKKEKKKEGCLPMACLYLNRSQHNQKTWGKKKTTSENVICRKTD